MELGEEGSRIPVMRTTATRTLGCARRYTERDSSAATTSASTLTLTSTTVGHAKTSVRSRMSAAVGSASSLPSTSATVASAIHLALPVNSVSTASVITPEQLPYIITLCHVALLILMVPLFIFNLIISVICISHDC
ncbi:hypothetical protein LINPERHAP2_LOCUS17072 [Linum perenne]